MNANERRKAILAVLSEQTEPMSASQLAERFSVSRQVIVGDVALLRAGDHKILATARGYLLESNLHPPAFTGRLVCNHLSSQTRDELYTIVDLGGNVLDVAIIHDIYGELVGQLAISSRAEADAFLAICAQSNARLLTELTDGVHLHSISCKDDATFGKIRDALDKKGILYHDDDSDPFGD